MSLPSRSGIVLVLCAPSGTGKTTLAKRLLEEFPTFTYSVSYTTRKPRSGEVHGRDYYFVTHEKFIRLRDEGFFAEWAEVHGNFYGTPLDLTLKTLEEGRDILFDVDVQGASQLKGNLPRHGCYVFLLPPTKKELEKRLNHRGTDDEGTIKRRLANAARELQQAYWFDALIVNAELDEAYDQLRSVFLTATLKPSNNPQLLSAVLGEW